MSAADSGVAVPPSPAGRRSWNAAHGLVCVTAASVVLSWAGVLVVVGSTVVPIWVLLPALLAACTVQRVGLRAFRVPRPPRGTRWRRLLPTVTVCAWVLGPPTAALDWVGSPTYTFLEPPGSDGCRAVVVEKVGFLSGSGTVHVLGGWGPFAPRVGGYDTDEGELPVVSGAYEVSWDDGPGGQLAVFGSTLGQGVSNYFDFDC
ncbi:MAG: hypothetical protein WA966_10195 [Ornithinimicrobium sp.]